ncbi:3-oxoacyl-[acyl-carrier-protein] reductase FabG [Helicoverpa armigera]|uniref:3-oxoacyl-[acyl-carrier-protein] reductase FabG n=1 Tax=Helicoverpa armigera TaxID=29058 RepID=UPI003083A90F
MNIDFTDKVVLVTGASAGIGESTALLFAALGAKLSLVGRNEGKLRAVAAACHKLRGLQPLPIVADLGTDEGVEKTAKETLDHFGKLDVLVNNAGISARTCLQLAEMATFDEVFRIDVRGVYNLTRLLVPALVQSKGNVVNVSSIAATVVAVGSLPYGMAKAALDHFTRLVALELAPKGVRVNAVSPGVTVSNIVKRMTGYTEEQYQEWLSFAAAATPMGKVCEGEDIARMIVHLASDHSRLVTGTIVEVDGGLRFAPPANLLSQQMKS